MSEIGIMAEPMIPNALSMPCICSVFTKASSVVIFMGETPSAVSLKVIQSFAGE
jgi:hypothetical protein